MAREAIVAGGPLALWRGASATLVGGVVYEGARFGTFGWLQRSSPKEKPSFLLGGVDFGPAVNGTLASLVAGNLIYPNDTVRRRLQTVAAGHESYLQATQALLQEGGIARLYRGFLLYNIKVAPSAAIQFFTYHELKRLYKVYSSSN